MESVPAAAGSSASRDYAALTISPSNIVLPRALLVLPVAAVHCLYFGARSLVVVDC